MEIWETSKVSKTMVPLCNKAMFISKGSCGYGKPKNTIAYRCNKHTGRFGPQIHPVSGTVYRAENGNLGNFEAVKNNGTGLQQSNVYIKR